RPSGVPSCFRRFCVERMQLVKVTEMSPKSLVTRISSVWIESPQMNNGIGAPLYLPGCAVGEDETGARPGPTSPTGTTSYVDLKAGGRVVSVLRLFRRVRSRHE